MAFFEQLFPPLISANASGGPRFINSKAYTHSGRRITNRDAALPIHDYSIAHPIRNGSDFDELRSFFYAVGGDADGFLFKDWTDYIATNLNTNLTLISGVTYQLNRVYVIGSRAFIRAIYKPLAGAVITRNRSSILSTATATVDTTTGIATISGHVAGDTYAWAGQFNLPVAFKNPAAIWHAIGGPNMLTEWASIEIEEIRL